MSAGLYANVRDESRKDKDGRKDNPGDFFEGFGDVEGLSASILVKTIRDICRKSDDGEVVEKRLDLETLVSTLLSFQASIAQDDIYSLLSIARDAPKEPETDLLGITANYKRSTRDLYIAFVKRCIDTSGCLDIICRHWAPPVRDVLDQEVELPSWISKLSKSPFGLPGQGQGRQNGENFVGCTHGDKRKRYDASQGTSPVLPVQLISENALSESPMNSPTIEENEYFQGTRARPRIEQRYILASARDLESAWFENNCRCAGKSYGPCVAFRKRRKTERTRVNSRGKRIES